MRNRMRAMSVRRIHPTTSNKIQPISISGSPAEPRDRQVLSDCDSKTLAWINKTAMAHNSSAHEPASDAAELTQEHLNDFTTLGQQCRDGRRTHPSWSGRPLLKGSVKRVRPNIAAHPDFQHLEIPPRARLRERNRSAHRVG